MAPQGRDMPAVSLQSFRLSLEAQPHRVDEAAPPKFNGSLRSGVCQHNDIWCWVKVQSVVVLPVDGQVLQGQRAQVALLQHCDAEVLEHDLC